MKVSYEGGSIEKLCKNPAKLRTKWGEETKDAVHQRLIELDAAESLADIFDLGYPRLHWLKGNLSGLLALNLDGSKRLIIRPNDTSIKDLPLIKHAVIIRIERDYH